MPTTDLVLMVIVDSGESIGDVLGVEGLPVVACGAVVEVEGGFPRSLKCITLLRAASTLSGMWSLNILGEMSTSSKAVLSAQMAW